MSVNFIQRESLSLRVTAAALIAIAIVVAVTFRAQMSDDVEDIRSTGLNLARLINKLPASVAGWQEVLRYQLGDPDYAYGAIIASDGRVLVEIAAPEISIPIVAALENEVWVREAERTIGAAEFMEFHGPLRLGDQRVNYRIGYLKPTIALTIEQLPFFASLMLPVFLLAPLFLLLLKREVDPLRKMNRELGEMLQADKSAGKRNRPVDLRSFAMQFNEFLAHAKQQIDAYQDEKSKLVTSERFLGFRLGRLESILNSVPDALVVVGEDACISYANDAMAPYLAADPAELIGSKVTAAVDDADLIAHLDSRDQSIAALVGDAFEFSPGGHPEASVRVTVHPLHDAGEDNGRNYLLVFADVSREARARQSRSEFVAHLAHELKAPLNTLGLYSEALQTEVGANEEFQLEATNAINDEVERLARLINNLLSMTQIEMGTLQTDLQRIKLVELVKDTTENIARSTRGQDLTFDMDMPNEVIPVQVDKDLMRIAISNLLTNAIKYTDAGGKITVSVSESDEAVTICVADTGIGIAAEEQTQIFEKFYRVSGEHMENRTGHGLGLPLARDIVAMHHGSMRVESQPGAGSRFYIDLWKHTGVLQQAI